MRISRAFAREIIRQLIASAPSLFHRVIRAKIPIRPSTPNDLGEVALLHPARLQGDPPVSGWQ